MRILFSSFPAVGHLLPMLPLARAARAFGDDVLVTADEAQRALVGDLPFAAAGPSLVDLIGESERRTGVDLRADVVETQAAGVDMFTSLRAELSLAAVHEVAREYAPELIVHEMWDYVAPLVAAELGVPRAVFSHSPDTLIDGPLAAGQARLFDDHGLVLSRPVGLVQQWPDWLQLEGHRARPDEMPIGLEPVVPDVPVPDMSGRHRSVLVTLGTAVADPDLLERLVASVLRVNADLVVTSLAGRSPESFDFSADPRVRVVGFVPFGELVCGVDAVVAAGGSGTTLTTLQHRQPMVFLPQFANQPVIAGAVQAYGAGISCPDVDAVPAALTAVLDDPAYAARAGDAGDALAARPTPDEVWPALRARVASRY